MPEIYSNQMKVAWTTSSGIHGRGVVIRFDAIVNDVPHYFVAVDAEPGEEHRVIYCAHTWITAVI